MKKLLTAAVALALAIPAVAAAGGREVGVRYADLDLTQRSDAAVMVRRLEKAAMDACGASKVSVRELRREVLRSDCHRETMEAALSVLSSPTVNAVYRERPVLATR